MKIYLRNENGKFQFYENEGEIKKRVTVNKIILGNRVVLGNEVVLGNRVKLGNGVVLGDEVKLGDWVKLNKDYTMRDLVAGCFGQYPVKGKYIFYKKVIKISKGKYASVYDYNFIYQDGKVAEVKNPNMDKTVSCGTGIHVSTPTYWNEGNTLIMVEVKEDDIITCLEGKVRCKKVKVIGEV